MNKEQQKAIDWLTSEYPTGVELIYIDYRDSFDENTAQLQAVLKGDNDDIFDGNDDGSYEAISYIITKYEESFTPATELSDETKETMQEWLQEHDTSTPTKDLLKHTSKQLCYIETDDRAGHIDELGEDGYKEQLKALQAKYAQTDEQKKEIKDNLGEQFYSAPVSFYFYADPLDLYEAIHGHDSKYIQIIGAYFSTVDRVQGSNWLGDNAVFNITVPREQFIKSFFLDKAKGNGYGWDSIAGQTGYDEAVILPADIIPTGSYLLTPEVSEAQQREQRLQANWDKTHKCTAGDMNWNRHTGKKEYINNYPCGNKCEDCGTFWID